jgi:hypothetical protein
MSTAAILGGPVGVGAWRAFMECPGGIGAGSSAAVGSANVIVLCNCVSFWIWCEWYNRVDELEVQECSQSHLD